MSTSQSVVRQTKRRSVLRQVLNGISSAASFPVAGTAVTLGGGHRSAVVTLQTRSGSATYAVKFYGNPNASAARTDDTTKELFARRKDAGGASATGLLSTVTANGHYEVDVDGMGVLWVVVTSLTGAGLLDAWVRESDNGSPIRNQAAWMQAKAGAADGGDDPGHHLGVGGTVESEIASAVNNGKRHGLSLNSYRFLRVSAHAGARTVAIGKADITADEQYFDPSTNGLSKGGILTQHLIGGQIGTSDAGSPFASSNSRIWVPLLAAPQRYNALTVGLYIAYADRYMGAASGIDPTIVERSFNVQVWAAYDETDAGAYFKLLPDIVVPAMTTENEAMRLLFTGAPMQEYATPGDPTAVVSGMHFQIPAFRGGTIPGVQFKITRIGPAYTAGAITAFVISRGQ